LHLGRARCRCRSIYDTVYESRDKLYVLAYACQEEQANEWFFFVPTGNDLSAGSLCLRQWTPVCAINATATSQTCDSLAEKWNITPSIFVNYNDNVNDACSNLVIGQPVRVLHISTVGWRADWPISSVFSTVLRLDQCVRLQIFHGIFDLSTMNGCHLG
jgi:hypothetical protein